MKGCGTPQVHAGLLLLVRLHFLLMPGVAPRWFGCAFLAHASHMGYVPIPGLRVLLRCQASWSRFLGMMAFLLASCVFGARGTLGWKLTVCTFLWCCCGRRGQSRAFVNVPLHLLNQCSYSTEAGPTCEIGAVMCADNVVEVCQIILDSIRTEWATGHAWPVPVLCFIRPEDGNTSECTPCMQLLQ